MTTCMLELAPRPPCPPPMASWCKRLLHRPTCFLPASWHHVSKIIYSEKGLQLERERQINVALWLMIHPYSSFKFYWDCFVMLVYFVSLIYLPIQVFFPCCNPYDPIIFFGDATGFLYIITNLSTGSIAENGKNVDFRSSKIAASYMKKTFVFDVLSALPLQVIPLYEDCRFPTHTIMFIFKLLRLIACSRVWKSIAHQLGASYLCSTSIIAVLRALMFYLWMTFCHYQVPVFMTHLYKMEGKFHGMLRRFQVIGDDGEDVWVLDKFVTNLYHVAEISFGAGEYIMIGKNTKIPEEQLLCALMSLLGMIFNTYLCTTALRLIVYRNYSTYMYNGLEKELQEYLDFKNVPQRLYQKIQLYINYRFNGRYFNQPYIMNTINVQIKQEINMHCCRELVNNVPLFQDMPIALLNSIIFSLTQVLYMPGEVVVKYGNPGSSIYLIAAGTVAIMDSHWSEVGHIKDGGFFGERALVKPGTLRSATIIALEITEIYKINHYQLQAALQPYPRLKRRLFGATEPRPSPASSA